jgi:hypothetical protein
MKNWKALVLVLLAPTLGQPAAAEGWVCLPDGTVGFDYDKKSKKWVEEDFNQDARWVIRRSKYPQANIWEVVPAGDDNPFFYCKEDFTEQGFLSCGEFSFSQPLGKFSVALTWSYFRSDEALQKMEKPDSVGLIIGRCTAI